MDTNVGEVCTMVENESPKKLGVVRSMWLRDPVTGRLMRDHGPEDHIGVSRNDIVPDTRRSMFDRWIDDAVDMAPKHPEGWNKEQHYMNMGWCWCGQSCPCCRAKVGDTLGGCEICIRQYKYPTQS